MKHKIKNTDKSKKTQLYKKTENFLNNQKYIFWKLEQKKLVSIFNSQKIVQTLVSYLWLINSMIYFAFVVILIYLCVWLYGYLWGKWWWSIVLIIVLLWLTAIHFSYKWICAIQKTKINNVKEYFFTDNNNLNIFLWLIIVLGGSLFVSVKFWDRWWAALLFLPLILLLNKWYSSILVWDLSNKFKLNLINLLLFPFVVLLFLPIFIISYLISIFFKYQIFKLQPKWNMLENFEKIEDRSWWNGFYEIIKR